MPMHTNRLHYVVLALVTIALLGIWDGMRCVLLPHLMADLSLTPAQVATIFSATALGYCLAALGFGPLSRRLGLKRLCGAGALVCAGALALFLTMRSPAALYVALLLFGAGLTGLDMGTSIPVSVLYGEQQGGVLNLLHGFFGLGALAGPLYGVVLLQLGAGWRVSFLITGVLLAVCALAFQALPAVALPQAPREQGGWMPLLLDPTFRGAFVALSCSVAAEVGMALWLPSFLQQVKGLSEGTGAFYTTLVFAGFTTARIGGTWFVGRLGYVRSVVILAALGAGGVAGLLVLPGSWAWLSLPAGAGIGVVFPTCTSARLHPPSGASQRGIFPALCRWRSLRDHVGAAHGVDRAARRPVASHVGSTGMLRANCRLHFSRPSYLYTAAGGAREHLAI